jgi:hypothetical protein
MAPPTLKAIYPAESAYEVTPSNTTDLPSPTRGIYVGNTGNVRVQMKGGQVVDFVALAAGVIHAIQAVRIHSSGTTATNILALY